MSCYRKEGVCYLSVSVESWMKYYDSLYLFIAYLFPLNS